MGKKAIIGFILVVAGVAILVYTESDTQPPSPDSAPPMQEEVAEAVAENPVESVEPTQVEPIDFIQQDVPFTAQAPFGDWDDPRQQDGCEEASILMAAHWVLGTTFTPENALAGILDLSESAEARFGYFQDTDVTETTALMNSYFGLTAATAFHDITLQEIKEALWQGNIVLVPADGQALENPNFTDPGPERHMLAIIGYDALTNEFITNDPGTKNGEGYRYNEDLLYTAIRDYPSGEHEPITEHARSMIVVSKAQ